MNQTRLYQTIIKLNREKKKKDEEAAYQGWKKIILTHSIGAMERHARRRIREVDGGNEASIIARELVCGVIIQSLWDIITTPRDIIKRYKTSKRDDKYEKSISNHPLYKNVALANLPPDVQRRIQQERLFYSALDLFDRKQFKDLAQFAMLNPSLARKIIDLSINNLLKNREARFIYRQIVISTTAPAEDD